MSLKVILSPPSKAGYAVVFGYIQETLSIDTTLKVLDKTEGFVS